MAGGDFDSLEYRKALGCFLTGVTVVTTVDELGRPRGFTANSFTSVSMDPPLVLICIGNHAHSYGVFSEAEHFGVNILSEHHREVSNIFASKHPEKFAQVGWNPGGRGCPLFEDAVAWLDCVVHQRVEAGDHMILIGRVLDFTHSTRSPLGYCRSNYVSPGLDQVAVGRSEGRKRQVGAILETDGRLLFLVDPGTGHLTLPVSASLGDGSADSGGLLGLLAENGVHAEIEFLFSVYDDDNHGLQVFYRGTVLKDFVPDPKQTRLCGFDEIPWDDLTDQATQTMLRRYIDERRNDLFGVYVGDSDAGDVRRLQQPA